MLNKVVIMGRLTRDPEVRKVNNDVSVCSFSVACDRDIVSKGSNERETDFFDVTACALPQILLASILPRVG